MSCRYDIVWYRGFHDVPLLFCIRVRDGYLVFDCPFDDALDDYSSVYLVSHVPSPVDMSDGDVLTAVATLEPIAEVPRTDVRFDETRRQSVELLGEFRAP